MLISGWTFFGNPFFETRALTVNKLTVCFCLFFLHFIFCFFFSLYVQILFGFFVGK